MNRKELPTFRQRPRPEDTNDLTAVADAVRESGGDKVSSAPVEHAENSANGQKRLIGAIAVATSLVVAVGLFIGHNKNAEESEKPSTPYSLVMKFAENYKNGELELPEGASEYTITLKEGDNVTSVLRDLQEETGFTELENEQARSTVYETGKAAMETYIKENDLPSNNQLHPGDEVTCVLGDVNKDGIKDAFVVGVNNESR